ncbi:hypothetical protein MN116_003657 [Schistosoma mekongi]|uniref:Uncharacterized protein n=1 Tax=Schistosoma mekongi TaxID=38744 RepID=A0AAE1ZE37_SCHME|nr:hypothetical protein MN116_003657 [Schistosoma mekongi]
MMLIPPNPLNCQTACEPFIPYGIAPGLVKQVREKFQSEISMQELSKNPQPRVKHHSATARLTCAYENYMHNGNGVQRHNTYPNRRIQSSGRVSDTSSPTGLTRYLKSKNYTDTLKIDTKSPTPLVSNENAKSNPTVYSNEYRLQTAPNKYQLDNINGYSNTSSNISGIVHNRSHPNNQNALKYNESENKQKESDAFLAAKYNMRNDFKQPAVLPKPQKCDLTNDSLINLLAPRGFEARKQLNQHTYSDKEHLRTLKSENVPNKNLKSRSLQNIHTLSNDRSRLEKSDQKNMTIKISERSPVHSNPPIQQTDNNHSHRSTKYKNSVDRNSPSDLSSKHVVNAICNSSEIFPTLNKYNKATENMVNGIKALGNSKQIDKEPVCSTITCNHSPCLNGIPNHKVGTVVSSSSKATSSLSFPRTPSILSFPLQFVRNNQPKNTDSHVKKKPLTGKPSDCSLPKKDLKQKELCEHQYVNNKEDRETFFSAETAKSKTSVFTKESNTTLHRNKCNTNNTTQLSHKRFCLPGNVSSKAENNLFADATEKSKPTNLNMNPSNQSKDIAVIQSSIECLGKVSSEESKSSSKLKEKNTSLPYHKRQVNYTILDTVMGEMEQLFSGKQTYSQNKLSRIHNFAREKAMQYREEKCSDEDNQINVSTAVKTPETNDADQKALVQGAGNHNNTASNNSGLYLENEKQSERFQAALRAVEKNLKLFSADEDAHSSKLSRVNDKVENLVESASSNQSACSIVEKYPADQCNPTHIKITINKENKCVNHQNALNEQYSTKITSIKELSVQNEQTSEIQSNSTNRSIDFEVSSETSVTDSQQSISPSRTSFPRPQPCIDSCIWPANQNNKTYIQSTYTTNRSFNNINEMNTNQNTLSRKVSQITKHFPRLSTIEIPCERPKSAPVKNGIRKINYDCKDYSVHQPRLLTNGNINVLN